MASEGAQVNQIISAFLSVGRKHQRMRIRRDQRGFCSGQRAAGRAHSPTRPRLVSLRKTRARHGRHPLKIIAYAAASVCGTARDVTFRLRFSALPYAFIPLTTSRSADRSRLFQKSQNREYVDNANWQSQAAGTEDCLPENLEYLCYSNHLRRWYGSSFALNTYSRAKLRLDCICPTALNILLGINSVVFGRRKWLQAVGYCELRGIKIAIRELRVTAVVALG